MTHMHMYTSMEPLLVYVYISKYIYGEKGLWIIKSWKEIHEKRKFDCKEEHMFMTSYMKRRTYVYDILHEKSELQWNWKEDKTMKSSIYIHIYI